MTVELELWHLILMLMTTVGAFWALAQMLIRTSQQHLSERFEALTKLLESQSNLIRAQSDDMRRIERDLMGLKADLPRDYVRREDYTQTIATIMTKIDHATLLMQQAVREAYANASRALANSKDQP